MIAEPTDYLVTTTIREPKYDVSVSVLKCTKTKKFFVRNDKNRTFVRLLGDVALLAFDDRNEAQDFARPFFQRLVEMERKARK